MQGRIRSVSAYQRQPLVTGWEIASSVPGVAADLNWRPIGAPATAAAALRSIGEWDVDGAARHFDAEDWWYRVRFNAAPAGAGEQTILGFDGLATVAEVWLNGEPILSSDNMFLSHEIPVDKWLKGDNELVLRFRSLSSLLSARRPRPRWRAPMIEQQQLRWHRTTLLGRTPGWSPPAAPVGPWRPVWLEIRSRISIEDLQLTAALLNDQGNVDLKCRLTGVDGARITGARLAVSRGERTFSAALSRDETTDTFHCALRIDPVDLWWPHTHGDPALYEVRLDVSAGDRPDEPVSMDLGRIGFRTVTVDTNNGNFSLQVNGVPVFCRGACWTPLDCISLQPDSQAVAAAMAQATAAGMNMLRVGGTMVYESDAFFDACDAAGILVWQEFMFANMDYPQGDAAFDASVGREVRQLLQRLSGRPSLAVLCGNSESEQQAAMWGAPRERWEQPLFHQFLPELTKALAPDIPYWPSSAHGGAFPHQASSGTSSYYGVGAYRRPLMDARLAEVRFATECLGFANIPEEPALAAMPGGLSVKVHHPQWKARSPRDLGAGWDFDDVRDHYLTATFGAQALDLRYSDHERYMNLSRVASGEVMAAVFREWRRKRSICNGGLVWFLRDLWPGAGWGIVDSLGTPKAAWHILRRALQPRSVFFSDEGVNGLFLHLANETAQPIEATVEIALYRSGEIPVGRQQRPVTVPARETLELPVASLFDSFMDLTHAYRFGPPVCDLVVATLTDGGGHIVSRDFHFPAGHTMTVEPDVGLAAAAKRMPDGSAELSVSSRRAARFVTVQVEGFAADDQYFHIAPGMVHRLRLRPRAAIANIQGQIQALNSTAACKLTLA